MSTTCPNCRAQITGNSTRCQACGRSLVQATTRTVNAASATPAGSSPPAGAGKGDVSEYVIHGIIGFLCGIAGFVAMMFISRRMFARHADDPIVWVAIIGLGFILPAVAGFRYSYQQEVIAKRRKQEGIQSMRK